MNLFLILYLLFRYKQQAWEIRFKCQLTLAYTCFEWRHFTMRKNHRIQVVKVSKKLEIQVIYVQLDQYDNCKNIEDHENNKWCCHVSQHANPCIFDLFIPCSEIFLILTFCRLKLHLFTSVSRYIFNGPEIINIFLLLILFRRVNYFLAKYRETA